ncbi:hypothetical protein G7Y79_00057g090640 [Physcia stellaris]|nr:hypothetical protein G7Y79_00057g090640 [Physcia stellaris]
MSRLFLLAFFCAWFSSAAALLPALPINDTASSSSASEFPLTSRVQCSGGRFGVRLSRIRCDNAWEKIEQSIQPQLFAQRDTEEDIFSLPFRYLSDDGSCAIDLSLIDKEGVDVCNGLGIAHAARRLIDECIVDRTKGGPNVGGVTSDFTPRGNLIVTLSHYTSTVECIPPAANPPTVESCNDVLQAMPASTDVEVFTKHAVERTVHVPWFLVDKKFGSNRCKLNVNLYRSGAIMETTTWFNIWTAGVAINEICIKRGMLGTAYSLG